MENKGAWNTVLSWMMKEKIAVTRTNETVQKSRYPLYVKPMVHTVHDVYSLYTMYSMWVKEGWSLTF